MGTRIEKTPTKDANRRVGTRNVDERQLQPDEKSSKTPNALLLETFSRSNTWISTSPAFFLRNVKDSLLV